MEHVLQRRVSSAFSMNKYSQSALPGSDGSVKELLPHLRAIQFIKLLPRRKWTYCQSQNDNAEDQDEEHRAELFVGDGLKIQKSIFFRRKELTNNPESEGLS